MSAGAVAVPGEPSSGMALMGTYVREIAAPIDRVDPKTHLVELRL